jgi:hypothetical protein
MGARLYNRSTGMFLQPDPVRGGGSTIYGYPTDPVNMLDLNGKMWGWVFKAGMWTISHLLGAACALTGALTMVCQVAVGAAVGALYYIGWHKYVKHDSWSTTGVKYAAIDGAVSGMASGLFSRTFGDKFQKFWVGHGSHMMETVAHKLWSMGWHALSDLVWTVFYWVMTAVAKLTH